MGQEALLKEIGERGAAVFGTGYVARVFTLALGIRGYAGQISAYVVSRPGGQETFLGKPVLSADAYLQSGGDQVLCLAVHESIAAEVTESLARAGLRGIWIYPFLYDLLYGTPVPPDPVRIPLGEILRAQDPAHYWIAARYGAALSILRGEETGMEVYQKALSLFSSPHTAEKRAERFASLIREISARGFDPGQPVLLDASMRIIDGLHRIALAALLGEEELSCRIYPASEVYEDVLDDRNFLTEDLFPAAGFSEEEKRYLTEKQMQLALKGKERAKE